MNNNINNQNNPSGNKLRCINIDCVFNSSNKPDSERNFCQHPNLKIESRFADITIAICSEFRSKKDYRLENFSTLIELKTNEKILIEGTPEPSFTGIEKVTQDDLEKSIKKTSKIKPEKPVEPGTKQEVIYEKAAVISANETFPEAEAIILAGSKASNLQLLKRLYQPNLRRGIIFSIIFHLFALWVLFIGFVSKNENNNVPPQQRIVVVEDIETPKFNPPDIDEPEEPKTDETIGDNTKEVRPKIIPKNIRPKINRPVDEVQDTTELTENKTGSISDSLRRVTDSLLALLDTSRIYVPDSLKNFIPENEIGMKLWYPKNWKLTDNRSINLTLKEFNGVMINTDSLSEDPGAVQMIIYIDDQKHTYFNKTTFKNTFEMDDSLVTAFSTDPTLTGAKKIMYKFFIFTDPTGEKNVFVSAEVKQDLFEKYRKYIEAIVRSIQIIKKTDIIPDGDNN